jgi:hypothetical protein
LNKIFFPDVKAISQGYNKELSSTGSLSYFALNIHGNIAASDHNLAA